MIVQKKELVEVPDNINITDLLMQHVTSGDNPLLFARKDSHGIWQDITAEEFYNQVSALAKGLIALGFQPGDRIGIMSKTRFEWSLIDFAIAFAGCTSVPVYETSSPQQIEWILSNSEARGIFVETPEHESYVKQKKEQLPHLEKIWTIQNSDFIELADSGTSVSDEELETRRTLATAEDVATIVYTSGTTGKPKGCELMHGNFTKLSKNCALIFSDILKYQDKTLMFLPLAHVLARIISILCVDIGIKVGHTSDIKKLTADLQEFHPNFILAVPRVFEKIFNTIQLQAKQGKKGKIFEQAEKVAINYSKAQLSGKKIPFTLNAQHKIFTKLVYEKLLKALGGNMGFAASGGAPLGENLSHFYNGAGLPIYEGYGLTETCAPVTFVNPQSFIPGTVGPPVPGVTVKIAEDQEILVQGIDVFKGYWNNPEATEEIKKDGWLHTGDLGTFLGENLKIIGRKKEILVTAGGKNIVPALLEDQIRSSALVSQCLVIGDQKPYVAALVTLDDESLPLWLAQHHLPEDMSMEEACKNPQIQAEVQKTIDQANESVSKAEAIKQFRLVPTDFTEDSGHLTPSLKIKRSKVMQDFDDVVNEIYSSKKPATGN
ncbi:MAG: AMP-dependent synthetase/ligase [Micrococcaceae bacterium]